MGVAATELLHSFLMVLNRLPGKQALLFVPLAFGYSKLDPKFCSSKADAQAPASPAAAAPSSGSGAHTTAAVTDSALPGPLGVLATQLMGQNQFASGGLVLMAVGAAAAGARLALGSALRYCRRHVMVTAEIDSRDDAYRWVMHWLSQHPKFSNSTMVSVTTNLSGTFGTSVVQHPLASSSSSSKAGEGPPVAYLPAPGDHLLRYQGRWLCISRRRATGNPQLAANARLLLETLSISLLGTNRQPLHALLAEAAAAYNQSQATRTAVHSVDQDGYWSQVGSRPIRPLSTVVLPQGQADALFTDCQEFLASEQWYAHHGIPYRRGYLLYGPPGTGKTSLVMALAGALGLEIYVVTLSSPTMTDETLRNLLNSAGVRSILLLEDVDAAFVDRSAGGGGAARLTFSGLLNAIDGVAAQEGRLLFMTTNHIERLNDALIRPGRVDVRCFLGPATRQQARDLFVSFYRDLPHLLLRLPQDLAAAAVMAEDEVPLLAGSSQGMAGAQSAAAATNKPSPVAAAGDDSKAAAADQAQLQQQPGHKQPHAVRSASLSTSRAEAAAAAQELAQREAVLVDLAQQFAAQLPAEGGVSMAQLQGFLMTHRKDPWAAVASVAKLLQQAQQQQQQQEELEH
ncbi:hypothetical protein OEZ86_011640 [Tetradesmus obliquus]|nr:hypothetical protein OEZ86_011640 [Tetradesmus obliquus]